MTKERFWTLDMLHQPVSGHFMLQPIVVIGDSSERGGEQWPLA